MIEKSKTLKEMMISKGAGLGVYAPEMETETIQPAPSFYEVKK